MHGAQGFGRGGGDAGRIDQHGRAVKERLDHAAVRILPGLTRCVPDEQQEEMALLLYSLLASTRASDDLESELFDLLGLEAFEDVQTLLVQRGTVVASVQATLAKLDPALLGETGGRRERAGASGPSMPSYGPQVTIATEAEKRLAKVCAAPRALRASSAFTAPSAPRPSPAVVPSHTRPSQQLRKDERRRKPGVEGDRAKLLVALGFDDDLQLRREALSQAAAAPLFKPSATPAVKYPHVRPPLPSAPPVRRQHVVTWLLHGLGAHTRPGVHEHGSVDHHPGRGALPAAAGHRAQERA